MTQNKIDRDTRNQNLKSFLNFRRSDRSAFDIGEDGGESSIIADSSYLRQSASLVSDALQKGFDILQLANGDIIATGTKTVVYKYTWNDAKGKLVKTSTEANDKSDPQVEPSKEDEVKLDLEEESA